MFVVKYRSSMEIASILVIREWLKSFPHGKMGDITGKALVFYSELGEITGISRVLPCGFALIYFNRYFSKHIPTV